MLAGDRGQGLLEARARQNNSIHPIPSPAAPKMTPSAVRVGSFRVGIRAS
jgi:hypothetical protein